MPGPAVYIVRTGTANVASVEAGFARLGAETRFVSSTEEALSAQRLVLPGVGTLEAAMRRLAEQELAGPIRARVEAGRPTLAICLGMQMLFEGSEESPEAAGLGIVPGRASRYPGGVRVPQLGWNRIEAQPGTQVLDSGYAYFANSYRITAAPMGWKAAIADYAGDFVAAIERGPVVACQFHPELSGDFGLGIMRRWLECSR